MISQIESWREQGLLTDIDVQFAILIGRLADQSDPIILAACLLSKMTGEGHSCVSLKKIAGRPVLGSSIFAPPLDEWLNCLQQSAVVGRAGDFTPLILDQTDKLYLHRYQCAEQQLTDELIRRAVTVDGINEGQLREQLDQLFPRAEGADCDWQKVSAGMALTRRLVVISGGPGTGKTTTVVRILALLLQQAGADTLKIGLAAPTGKAAARMMESILAAKQSLAVSETIRNLIPERAETLHRLLGSRVNTGRFRHDENNPLSLDVLIVDEASMIDLSMMTALMKALPASSRLILLGDKDQLSSVEAGTVLGDICASAGGFSAGYQQQLSSLTGELIGTELVAAERSATETVPTSISDSVVLLQKSHRFDAQSAIGQLARAVNNSDWNGRAGMRAILQSDQSTSVVWLNERQQATGQPLLSLLNKYLADYFQLINERADVEKLLTVFDRFRILCAHREGSAGALALNQLIESRLIPASFSGQSSNTEAWYHGRPIMISQNDHELGLFNGDIGIAVKKQNGDLRVCFPSLDTNLDVTRGWREVNPLRLPAHNSAYAMTIHKSQGSEFEHVLLMLPEKISAILSSELLYTGITRAKSKVTLVANETVLKASVTRRTQRESGLANRLVLAAP